MHFTRGSTINLHVTLTHLCHRQLWCLYVRPWIHGWRTRSALRQRHNDPASSYNWYIAQTRTQQAKDNILRPNFGSEILIGHSPVTRWSLADYSMITPWSLPIHSQVPYWSLAGHSLITHGWLITHWTPTNYSLVTPWSLTGYPKIHCWHPLWFYYKSSTDWVWCLFYITHVLLITHAVLCPVKIAQTVLQCKDLHIK